MKISYKRKWTSYLLPFPFALWGSHRRHCHLAKQVQLDGLEWVTHRQNNWKHPNSWNLFDILKWMCWFIHYLIKILNLHHVYANCDNWEVIGTCQYDRFFSMVHCNCWNDKIRNIMSLVWMAERSRAEVWVCWSVPLVRIWNRLQPM